MSDSPMGPSSPMLVKPSGKPIVIKIGGATVEDPLNAPRLWDSIAMLSRGCPGCVVVVHGGGKAVDRLLEQLGLPVEKRNGLRVTPPEHMDYITGVLAGSMNKRITASLLSRGTRAVGICLGDGFAIRSTRRTSGGLGMVGDVYGGEQDGHSLLRVLLWNGFTPVISSIGIEWDGELLNINADDAAAAVASNIGAESLLLMTDVPGILDGRGVVVPEVDASRVERMIQDGEIKGGMIVKARAAVHAAVSSGLPVTILSGNDPTALSKWMAGDPVGTIVQPIRSADPRA